MKNAGTWFVVAVAVIGLSGSAFAHCEIPCGIYDDRARIAEMQEHVTTIEKSMTQISELSAANDQNYNQIVRWVNNKEDHATKLQEIVTQYFMFQRIKPVDQTDAEAWAKYQNQLTLAHQITVYAMKAKQSLDPEIATKLREAIEQFQAVYFLC